MVNTGENKRHELPLEFLAAAEPPGAPATYRVGSPPWRSAHWSQLRRAEARFFDGWLTDPLNSLFHRRVLYCLAPPSVPKNDTVLGWLDSREASGVFAGAKLDGVIAWHLNDDLHCFDAFVLYALAYTSGTPVVEVAGLAPAYRQQALIDSLYTGNYLLALLGLGRPAPPGADPSEPFGASPRREEPPTWPLTKSSLLWTPREMPEEVGTALGGLEIDSPEAEFLEAIGGMPHTRAIVTAAALPPAWSTTRELGARCGAHSAALLLGATGTREAADRDPSYEVTDRDPLVEGLHRSRWRSQEQVGLRSLGALLDPVNRYVAERQFAPAWVYAQRAGIERLTQKPALRVPLAKRLMHIYLGWITHADAPSYPSEIGELLVCLSEVLHALGRRRDELAVYNLALSRLAKNLSVQQVAWLLEARGSAQLPLTGRAAHAEVDLRQAYNLDPSIRRLASICSVQLRRGLKREAAHDIRKLNRLLPDRSATDVDRLAVHATSIQLHLAWLGSDRPESREDYFSDHLVRLLNAADRIGRPEAKAYATAVEVAARIEHGQLELAEPRLREAEELARESRLSSRQIELSLLLAECHCRAEQYQRAEHVLREVEALRGPPPTQDELVAAHWISARVTSKGRRREIAIRHAERAYELAMSSSELFAPADAIARIQAFLEDQGADVPAPSANSAVAAESLQMPEVDVSRLSPTPTTLPDPV